MAEKELEDAFQLSSNSLLNDAQELEDFCGFIKMSSKMVFRWGTVDLSGAGIWKPFQESSK